MVWIDLSNPWWGRYWGSDGLVYSGGSWWNLPPCGGRQILFRSPCSGNIFLFLFFFSFFVFSNVLDINIGNVVVACSDGMNEIYSGLCTKEKKDLETG